MPVYNCAQYLREAIESILGQTFQDFEFIIINDGSTDNTPEILREYANKDSRIRVINQPNSGIVTALNRGLKEAKGEWIFRMDGDDISLPYRFEAQIKMVEKNPSLVLVGGWCEQIDKDGISLKINKYPEKHEYLIKALENGRPFPPHPTAFYNKESVLKVGGYRGRFRHAEDTDLWLRLIKYGKIECYKGVLLKLRKHGSNISFIESKAQAIKSIAARICHFCCKEGMFDPSEGDEIVWNKFLNWLDRRLEEKGYFQVNKVRQDLRDFIYTKSFIDKFEIIMSILKRLLSSRSYRKSFLSSLRYPNYVKKIIFELKDRFKNEPIN